MPQVILYERLLSGAQTVVKLIEEGHTPWFLQLKESKFREPVDGLVVFQTMVKQLKQERWTNRQMDGQTDRWMDGKTGSQTGRWMDGKIGSQAGRWMDGRQTD